MNSSGVVTPSHSSARNCVLRRLLPPLDIGPWGGEAVKVMRVLIASLQHKVSFVCPQVYVYQSHGLFVGQRCIMRTQGKEVLCRRSHLCFSGREQRCVDAGGGGGTTPQFSVDRSWSYGQEKKHLGHIFF